MVVKQNLLFQLLFRPSQVFEALSQDKSPTIRRILPFSILILLLPPIFSWIGGRTLGWRLGNSDAVYFDTTGSIVFAFFYFCILCIGFFGTVYISRWMSGTYAARTSSSLHYAFFTVICGPLALASIAHLYPDVFFNVLILLPTFLWSLNLLYRGLPKVMGIPPERGMLMACALVGWLLVAAVSLLGFCVGLWVNGVGNVLGL